MATTTTNLGLTKPGNNDPIRVSVLNDNFDLIDQAVFAKTSDISIVKNNAGIEFKKSANQPWMGKIQASVDVSDNNRLSLRQRVDGAEGAEIYYLPIPENTPSNVYYTFLTNKSAVTAAQGGTGRTTLTSNAVLYGNGTGAVGMRTSANGALYATAANGALNWGTLPIAQGGTGATTAAAARTSLGLGSVLTDLSALQGALGDTAFVYKQLPASGSAAYIFSNNCAYVVLVSGPAASLRCLVFGYCTGAGSVTYTKMDAGDSSNITVSTSTNRLTIANGASSAAYALLIRLTGTAPT